MGFDPEIEDRLYPALQAFPELRRKTMFGGPAYLLNGNMCVGVYEHYLILRLGPERYTSITAQYEAIRPMDITGKPMRGWGMIDGYACEPEDFIAFTSECVAFVRTLPAKKKK